MTTTREWTMWALAAILGALLVVSPVRAEEITWFTIWPSWSPEQQASWDKQFAQFEEMTGIKVNVVHNTDDVYAARFLTMVAAGLTPDVVLVRGQREFARFGTMGDVLLDLTPYIERSDIPIDDYAPAMMEGLNWEGAQIALPHGADFRMGMYNLDHLNDVGLPEPGLDWTWDDVATMTNRLTEVRSDGTVERYGFSAPQYLWEELVLSAGVPALKEDGTFNWNRPDVHEMVAFFRDLFLNEGTEDTGGSFWSGEAAMQIGLACCIPPENFELNWNVTSFPRWREYTHGSQMIVTGFGIPVASDAPDAAFRFIEWYGSRERAELLLELGEPASSLVPDREIMLSNLDALGARIGAPRAAEVYRWTFEHGFQLLRPSAFIGDSNYWSIESIGKALNGEMGIPAAFEEAERIYNALLASGASWESE